MPISKAAADACTIWSGALGTLALVLCAFRNSSACKGGISVSTVTLHPDILTERSDLYICNAFNNASIDCSAFNYHISRHDHGHIQAHRW